MNMNFLAKMPKYFYMGVFIALYYYADSHGSWWTVAFLALALGVAWLAKACFPYFYQLDQRLRERSDRDVDDGSN